MIVSVLVAAFVVAQTCQKSQIRINKDQAMASAERQITFEPTREQIRLLRQGTFSHLAVVRIDANTGKVKDVRVQRNPSP